MYYNRVFSRKVSAFIRSVFPLFSKSYPTIQRRFPVCKIVSLAAGTSLILNQAPGIAQAKEIDFRFQTPDIPLFGLGEQLSADSSFVDIDGDGDFDAFIAGTGKLGNNILTYYENIGTDLDPLFRERVNSDNPLNVVNSLFSHGAPSFVDIDGDGDFDAFVGEKYGYGSTVKYYENTGNRTTPVFTQQDGADNPLVGVNVTFSNVGFVDIDGDGDFDAFIRGGGKYSSSTKTLQYYENTGTVKAAVFVERTGADNPLDGIVLNSYDAPSFVDIDGDGDFDSFVGDYFYRNTGTQIAPVFEPQTGLDDPLDGINAYSLNSPSFVDIDGDGNFDAFVGHKYGAVIAVKNNGTPETPRMKIWADVDVPLSGLNIPAYSDPHFVDIDNDGDYDAFSGDSRGTITYYENKGSSLKPIFRERTGTTNPFDGVNVGGTSSPRFVDIDNDGDFDAFVGADDGLINFFENTGSKAAPVFTEQIGAANPFDSVDVGDYSTPSFIDIDNDGDFDAFIGEREGLIIFYENTGTATAPIFTEQTGAANPFDGVDFGYFSSPTFTDIDGDGDFDAFIGEKAGIVNYFNNNGTETNPVFKQQTDWRNPFNGVDVGYYSKPSFVDINGSGRGDVFIGSGSGKIFYYHNYSFPWSLFAPAIIKMK